MVICKAVKGVSTFTCLLSLKEVLSFHLSVCTCFSSLPFRVHAPVQELEEEHNGYPSEAEAEQVASSPCSSVCSCRLWI